MKKRSTLRLTQQSLVELSALIEKMERLPSHTELSAFYQRRVRRVSAFDKAHKRQQELYASAGEHMTDLKIDLSMLVELSDAALVDRIEGGREIIDWHFDQISRILIKAKLHDILVQFKAAHSKHQTPVRRMIRNKIEDGLLNGFQSSARRLRIQLVRIDNLATGQSALFDTTCEECGGTEIVMPDGDDPDGPVVCEACGHVLCSRKAMEALARHVAKLGLR